MGGKDNGFAFLGKETGFEGTLGFKDTFKIDGHFKGSIHGKGTLIVGEEGTVESDIHADRVIITGEVHGTVTADEKIEIHVPGKVFGDMEAPSVVIDDGVIFEGNCRIHRPETHAHEEIPPDTPPEPAEDGWVDEPVLGTIYGVVTDSDTGKPIEGAVVKAKCKSAGKRKTKTGVSGYYELNGLEDGVWKLENKAKRYEKVKAMVIVTGGGRYEQNFK